MKGKSTTKIISDDFVMRKVTGNEYRIVLINHLCPMMKCLSPEVAIKAQEVKGYSHQITTQRNIC